MRFVFIINPVAGNRKFQPQLKEQINRVLSGKEAEYNIFESSAPGDCKGIACREAERGDECVIFACGGDGTLFEVLNGAYRYKNASIGIIPLGSGNDFIKSVGSKSDFLNIEYQIKGGSRPADIIRCGDTAAFNVASAGFDAHVADNMVRFKNCRFVSGSMSYMLSVFYCLFKFYSSKYRLTVDGEGKAEKDYMFALAANAGYYGGGFCPAPDVKIDDGFFDAVEVGRVSHLAILPLIGKYKKGKLEGEKCYRRVKAKKLVIEGDKDLIVNLDGEILHFENGRAEFENLHNAVRLWLPQTLLNADCFSEKYEQKVKITENA